MGDFLQGRRFEWGRIARGFVYILNEGIAIIVTLPKVVNIWNSDKRVVHLPKICLRFMRRRGGGDFKRPVIHWEEETKDSCLPCAHWSLYHPVWRGKREGRQGCIYGDRGQCVCVCYTDNEIQNTFEKNCSGNT